MNEKEKEELDRLFVANGGVLLAEKVVAVARNHKNPLHGRFEWDDSAAGHQWRLHQANQLIRSFAVTERSVERTTVGYRIDAGKATALPEFTPHPALPKGYGKTCDLLAGAERGATLMGEVDRCRGHVERLVKYLIGAGMDSEAKTLEAAMRRVRSGVESIRVSEAG